MQPTITDLMAFVETVKTFDNRHHPLWKEFVSRMTEALEPQYPSSGPDSDDSESDNDSESDANDGKYDADESDNDSEDGDDVSDNDSDSEDDSYADVSEDDDEPMIPTQTYQTNKLGGSCNHC